MGKALRNRETVLMWLQHHPGMKSTEIANELAISRVTVYLHLQELIREGRVEMLGQSTATRYFPIAQILQDNTIIQDIQQILYEKYEETVLPEDIVSTLEKYMMYIDDQDIISYGLSAFILWCHDSRHEFIQNIPEKAVEYIDLIGSIEYLRSKNGLLDVTTPAKAILGGDMEIGFDRFLICMVSVLSHGFGSTRTALSLRYGKKNSNRVLLENAISTWINLIRVYAKKHTVDAVIYTPPTEGRLVQFRDVLKKQLNLPITQISVEKLPLSGRILESQKNIRNKVRRIKNAMGSMTVSIPENINTLTHILILDDSFTTGATPNAIALRLREAGYAGKISIITICGSFDYDLAIIEDEI